MCMIMGYPKPNITNMLVEQDSGNLQQLSGITHLIVPIGKIIIIEGDIGSVHPYFP
jgi:hypothetical protein